MGDASESISIQEDLRILAQWLMRSGDASNTTELHEGLAEALLKLNNPSTSSLISSSDLLKILTGKGTKKAPDSVNQHVSKRVREKWWESRRSVYHEYAHSHGVRPLKLVEIGTRPVSFGYEIDRMESSTVLADTVIRYRRESIPREDMTRLARILYPEGIIRLQGWRRVLHWTKLLGISFWFMLTGLAAGLAIIFRPAQDAWALINAVILLLTLYAIYRWIILPQITFGIRRTRPVHPMLLRISSWDKADVVWEMVRNERRTKIASIEMVRWSAACPICKSIVDLADDEAGYEGIVVGRCRESSEHLFSFDRVTTEGRALRAIPKEVTLDQRDISNT
jgi:hypothetical protein